MPQHTHHHGPSREQLANRRRFWLTIGVLASIVFCLSPLFTFTADLGILSTRSFEMHPITVVMTQTNLQTHLVMESKTVRMWPILVVELFLILFSVMAVRAEHSYQINRALIYIKVCAMLFFVIAIFYILVLSDRMMVTILPSWPFVFPVITYACAAIARRAVPARE